MPDLRQIGQTSNTVRFKLTKSTDGTAFTGLTSASSGLIISTICDNEATATAYTQAGSTIETITTLGTFATPTTNKCRFKEIDSTNHPGLYEFQFANARFAVSNARRMIISVSGVSNLFSSDYEIEFTSTDLNITSLAIADTQDSQGITLAAIQAMTDDMPHYFGLIARADAGIATDHAAILALINENGGSGGGTYDNTTDSQEALRNNLATASTAAAAVLAGGDIDGFTLEETLKLLLASIYKLAVTNGGLTNTFRAADDSKNRITATVDGSGNRTAVTFDATG